MLHINDITHYIACVIRGLYLNILRPLTASCNWCRGCILLTIFCVGTPIIAQDSGDDQRSSAIPIYWISNGSANFLTNHPDTSRASFASEDDVDYKRINIPVPGLLVVETGGASDPIGVLENSDGNVIASSDDDGAGKNFKIIQAVDAGTYYLRIALSSGDTDAKAYRLHVRYIPETTDVDILRTRVVSRGLGDLNGDGRDDALLRHTDGRWEYYPMDGREHLTDGQGAANLTPNLDWQFAGIGDLNGDGKDDVLVRRVTDGRWYYYPMDGRRHLVGQRGGTSIISDLNWQFAGIGDLNGDGKDDVLLRHRDDGRWLYYPMDGRQHITGGRGLANISRDLAWRLAGIGDLNGDGKDDVLLRHTDGTWQYFPMNGREYLTDGQGAANLTGNPEWQMAGIGDMNGDGKDDVLLRHADGRWYYYPMNGREYLTDGQGAANLASNPEWQMAGIGDMNGDGRDDVLLRHTDGTWQYYPMDGREHIADGHGTANLTTDLDWRITDAVPLQGGTDGSFGDNGSNVSVLAPEMVSISGGTFLMGDVNSMANDVLAHRFQTPVHSVTVPDFRIGKYEVTFDEWDACWADGGCRGHWPHDDFDGRGNRPVINVSWDHAQLFINWLNRKTGGGYRLPTEAEWEYAARAGTTTEYSWGNDIGLGRASCSGCSSFPTRRTSPVGSFSANPWGLHDMHGNASEWVQDCLNYDYDGAPRSGYEGAPSDGSAWESGYCSDRIWRGGSWSNSASALRSAWRGVANRAGRGRGLGFRLAQGGGPGRGSGTGDSDGSVGDGDIRALVPPEMVMIPGGTFRMGDLNNGVGADSLKPVHSVTVPAFRLGKYEVTFAQWDACVADGGCGGFIPFDEGYGRGNRPVINVSWDDIQLFIEWLNIKTGGGFRLPTEAEWEYAARAGTMTEFSWGDDIGHNLANCSDCDDLWYTPAPVGSYPANPWGLHDMHGNLSEWVQDCSNETYEGAPSDGSAWESGNCYKRMYRDGSWARRWRHMRSYGRLWIEKEFRSVDLGFRLAQDVIGDSGDNDGDTGGENDENGGSGSDVHSDMLSSATSLALGGSASGQIDPGSDVDYFSVQVSGSGTLTVHTTGDLDTTGELQNSAGSAVASDDDGGSGRNFRIEHTVNSGTYYIKVGSYRSHTGSYTIHVEFAGSGDMVSDDEDSTDSTDDDNGDNGNPMTVTEPEQECDVLVTNLNTDRISFGSPNTGNVGLLGDNSLGNRENIQSFATGPDEGGYLVNEVEVPIVLGQISKNTISLTINRGMTPNAAVAVASATIHVAGAPAGTYLGRTAEVSEPRIVFAIQAELQENTWYYLAMSSTSSELGTWGYTVSDDEGSCYGWKIGNRSSWRILDSTPREVYEGRIGFRPLRFEMRGRRRSIHN